MTTDAALPPVAKSLFTFCKKCNADRYHRVLAHTSTSKAKIECEICKSKKTYTAPKAGATPVRKKAPGVKGVGGRSWRGHWRVLRLLAPPVPGCRQRRTITLVRKVER